MTSRSEWSLACGGDHLLKKRISDSISILDYKAFAAGSPIDDL